MMIQTRILLFTFIFFGTASAIFAQSQPLPQAPMNPVSPNQVDSQLLTLTRRTPAELEQALRQICGHRFTIQSQYQYVFSANRNNTRQQCSLRIEPQLKRVVLSGDKHLCDQVFQLITAIDQPPPPGKERQIVPLKPTTPLDVLARALELCRTPAAPPRNETTIQQLPPNTIRQVDYQFQEGSVFDGGIDPAIPMQGGMIPGMQQPGNPNVVGMPLDEPRFIFFPGLDALAVEADGVRLKNIIEMIRQIEVLSEQNKPKVEVIHLKYINNASLGQFIQQFYNDIIQTVPGYARLIPMTMPNAIMLVGWGDMMDTAKELLTKLDQPMATENSLRHIFKLKHISAQNAAAFLRQTFPVPPGNSGFMYRVAFYTETRSNLLVVQAAPNDLEEVKRIINEIDIVTSAPKLQVDRIKLNHTLASDLSGTLRNVIASGNAGGMNASLELLIQSKEGKQLIESGILSNVTIEPDVRNNVIIVTAPENCMAFIKELVVQMDMSSPEAAVKIFQIINGDANSIEGMLTSLFPTVAAGTTGPQLPGSANEETLIPIRFAVDVRTNCLIVAGAPGDLDSIEALIESLDREDRLATKSEVYFLKNMKAENVALTIQTYLKSKLDVNEASVTTGVMGAFTQLEKAAIVVADTESNSLIIEATPKYFDEIMELVKEIDKSPPQVVIKVLIAEVTLSEDKEWAAELGLQDPLMFAKRNGISGPGLLFNSGNGANSIGDGTGAPGTVGSQILSNFDAGRVGQGGFGGLVFNASSDHLNIMLRALHEKKRLEVLSSPQITTMNNVKATIAVGQTVPRLKGKLTNMGISEDKIEDEDVTLDVQIVPTISPEGTIVMVVGITKAKIGSEVSVGSQRMATIDTATLGTMVCAADGQTVVLGGLLTKDTNKTRRKVPVLGDIPVLGKMFRHEIDATTRKELLVILTPRIVKTQDELEQVKQMEMARMSWCLSNVTQVYGDVGAYNVISERPYTGNAPVITPGPVKSESLQTIETPFIAPTLPKRN